ncbi:MAG TPA: response regulator [bacterium]|nr:response regulator [bacterium]
MKKIFIVEDDSDILYGLSDIFSSNDYEVELSDSTEELDDLLKRIKKFKPEAIILDLVLPRLEGLDIIKKIKEDDDTSNSEIFIFTDLSDEDSKSRSVGLGANYYFLKSEFDIYAFSNRVMRIMGRTDEADKEEESEEDDGLVMD